MLRPYKYPSHSINHMGKVQSFVNYIMLEVIINAAKIPKDSFSSDLIIDKYKSLVDGVNGKWLFEPLSGMFHICKSITREKRKILKRAVLDNNRISKLCHGELNPVRYSDLRDVFVMEADKEMPNLIRSFCDNLYLQCLDLKPFNDKYGSLKNHYDHIVGREKTCRSCGEESLFSKDEKHRDAFDHYFAKAIYPFVSVNFHNLVPTCKSCNESIKKGKDIILDNGERRQAFYPFSTEEYNIDIKVELMSRDILNLTPDDINIYFKCDGHDEEVENWLRVYEINDRYVAKCCSKAFISYVCSIIAQPNRQLLMNCLEANKEYEQNFLRLEFIHAAIKKIDCD